MQALEFTQNLYDHAWRLQHLYYIKDKSKNELLFKLNRIQRQIISEIENIKKQNKPVRLIMLKPRQLGITTLFCLMALDKVYFKRNQFAAILAHRVESANIIFNEIIKFAYDKMPETVRFKAYNDSVRQLAWRNLSSQILVTTDAHGLTPSFLHFTEVARMENAKELIGESLQSVPLNAEVIKESTANGADNYFHDDWYEAIDNKDSIWKAIFLKWWEHEEYRLKVTPKTKAPL